MKLTKMIIQTWLYGSMLCACNGERKQNVSDYNETEDLVRIENYSVNVTDDCVQIYEGSNCRAITANIADTDYMIAYSLPLHTIDLIALDSTNVFKQIQLEKEGPNGIIDVKGIFHTGNDFVLRTATGFCRVNEKGFIESKWNMQDFLSKNPEYTERFPEQEMFFSLYHFMGFDEKEGLVAIPFYKREKTNGEYAARILILSCQNWQIVEDVSIRYPQYLNEEEYLGNMGEIYPLPYGNDKLIYNFPASTDVFVFDRKTKSTQTYSIETKYTESYFHKKDEENRGISGTCFLPLRYDPYRHCFWRMQQKPRPKEGGKINHRSFSVTRISSNFEHIGEYKIPEGKNISSFSILFTDDKVLFPYLGGEYIGLDNMAFYGLKLY